MAIKDTTKKPFVSDNDENIFIGIDLPFRLDDGVSGWFASTETTMEAIKNNIRMLMGTKKGERYLQPDLGMSFHRFLFEHITDDTLIAIENDIVETFSRWLPFVQIKDIIIEPDTPSDSVGKHKLIIQLVFSILQDPTRLESVTVNIGE